MSDDKVVEEKTSQIPKESHHESDKIDQMQEEDLLQTETQKVETPAQITDKQLPSEENPQALESCISLKANSDKPSDSQEEDPNVSTEVPDKPLTSTQTSLPSSEKDEMPAVQEATQNATSSSDSTNSSDEYAEHVSYNDEGEAIYTDPKTNYKYKWCQEKNNWMPMEQHSAEKKTELTSDPYENEHYKWCSETSQWILKENVAPLAANAEEKSLTETEFYKWDAAKNQWIPKQQHKQQQDQQTPFDATIDIDENGQRVYTDKDGVVFFWDAAKSAWFPKIDDDFMARYQMNYGFVDNTSTKDTTIDDRDQQENKKGVTSKQQLELSEGIKRKASAEPPKWFDLNPEQNTKVYVSNLPLDITLDEFAEVMSKCGMIMRDAKTQKHKLKLYTEADGQVKGDGLCDYIKVESVDLALKILDDYDVRGHKLKVQRAKFQMRGEYNPELKPKRKKKDKEKLQKMKEKLFDWRPEKMRGERSKNEKIVIIKNLFTPDLFDKEVQLIIEYQTDLREECAKCGTVRKVVIYDRHPEGVAQINMASPEEADIVIQMMNGRFFGKRKLTAEHWDGKTKYKVAETDTEVQKRLTNWDTFLEKDEQKESTDDAEMSKSGSDCLTNAASEEIPPDLDNAS